MNMVLMCREKPACRIEYDQEANAILQMLAVDEDLLPFIVKNHRYTGRTQRELLNEWFRNRGIPKLRDGYDESSLMNEKSILGKTWYAASLSDQFWIRNENDSVTWDNINFFSNSYDHELSFGSNDKSNHPNRTTSGNVKKTWIQENGTNYLLKGGYEKRTQEPLNEVLASMIAEELHIEHVVYSTAAYENHFVCKCPCMINDHEEMISAYDIFRGFSRKANSNGYQHYRNCLHQLGIMNTDAVDRMFVLDYLIMNEDRHMENFALIRNTEDRNDYRIAPVYDSGSSMNSQKLDFEKNYENGSCKFFDETDYDFDKMINEVEGIESVDLSGMSRINDQWTALLQSTQESSHLSDQNILDLHNGLNRRIELLEAKQIGRI